MKKIFTLIAAFVFISAATFAQYNNNGHERGREDDDNFDRNRDIVVHNDYDKRGDDRNFGEGERNRQIDRINFEYNRKIDRVANNFFMSRHKKQYVIADLQARRENDIRFVWAKFNDRRGGYNQGNKDYHHRGRKNW